MTGPFLAPPPLQGLRTEPSEPPTFSVIVAAYQAADTIAEALDSAFAQTFPPLEVVVCDDGSTDDLDTALEPYRDRVVLLRRPHGGEGAAKDAAIRAAQAELVVILDADDVFLPGRLEALAEVARERPDVDIFATDAWVELDGRRLRRCYDESWSFEVDDQRTEILRRNFVLGHAAVRREALLAAGGFDPAMPSVADWDCWLRMILGGSRAGLVFEPLAHYRLRETSVSAQPVLHARGCVAALERTQARPDLAPDERAVLAATLAAHRRELARAEHDEAPARAGTAARGRALAVARDAGQPRSTRAKALAAAVLPGLARRQRAHRAAGGWVGAAHVHVSRSGPPPEPARQDADEAAEPVAGLLVEPRGVVGGEDADGGGEEGERDEAGKRPEQEPGHPADR